MLGLSKSSNPYAPDVYLDVEQIMWKHFQVFIGPHNSPKGDRVLEIAFLLNVNFPTEEKYEETLNQCSEIAGPEFTISSGSTENLEIWMSYLSPTEGSETEIIEKIQRACEIAVGLAQITTGIRHNPQINLK